MSNKRYGVTVPPEVWQTWRVLALKAGMSVGEWLTEQINFPAPIPGHSFEWKASMDEPVKKAIEPDKVKVQDGKLRKGLGPLPGEKEARTLLEKPDSYHSWNPAPKPGKK